MSSINNNDKILVTGASGVFGKHAIEFLLEKGVKSNNIIALVRDESKLNQQLKEKGIIIKKGDYNDFKSLLQAFQGVDKLLFVSSSDTQNRLTHHTNVINAAIKSVSIKFIAYTSFTRKHDSFDTETSIDFIKKSHVETERLLKESNIQHISLLNGLYADTLTDYFFGPTVLENGIFFPAGNGISNYATRKDLAEAAVNVILNNELYKDKTSLKFTSNESSTLYDAAAILSEVTGKTIQYTSPPTEIYKTTLLSVGLPEAIVDFSIAFANAIESNEFASDYSDLAQVLNRQPTTLKQFLTQHYQTQIKSN